MCLSHLPPEHSLGNLPVELVLTIGDFLTQADRSALSRTAVRFCEILTLIHTTPDLITAVRSSSQPPWLYQRRAKLAGPGG
jgi:hypothetical protein